MDGEREGSCVARIAHHGDLLLYDFGPYHPLRPERITAGLDLLESAGLWSPDTELLTASAARLADLHTVHDPDYVRAVDEAGTAYLPAGELARYGLTSTDNPPFPAMHYAAALVAGATTSVTREVLAGRLDHAFSPAGGLHHALRDRASGFCIYNDPAVAAAVAAREFEARVMYVDFDCHHGDGVQWLFYEDPNVLTISLHESGRFLFPGTGAISETGEGRGRGYAVNMPFAPFTCDDDWQEAVHALIPPLAHRFAPDILITNHGCDTHIWDPLTHLSLSTDSFVHQARVSHRLAHEVCGARWIAVGSGGYDWRRVVPRSWAIVWTEMTRRPLPYSLPPDWISRWDTESAEPLPDTFLDNSDDLTGPSPRAAEVRAANRDTLRRLRSLAGLQA